MQELVPARRSDPPMPRCIVWITVEGSPRYGAELHCCDDAQAEAEGNVIADRLSRTAFWASGRSLSYSIEIDNEDGDRIAEIMSLPIARNAA